MARFDVYMAGRKTPRMVVDVQSDFLSPLNMRVVIPLFPEGSVSKPIRDLNPVFEVNGKNYTLLPQFMASVELLALKRPIASLAGHWDEITRALDLLFTGF